MKAAVMEASREPLVVREVPDPRPGPDGAVVRVTANGICRSDWHGWAGDWPGFFELPHVLGHEMCGVIEEVGPHVSVDALGIEATCRNAIKSLRQRGRHVQIGITTGAAKGDLSVPIDAIVNKEIQILGSRGMPVTEFGAMLRMVAAGRLDPGKLVTRKVALEETSAVIAAMDGYDTLGFTVIDRF